MNTGSRALDVTTISNNIFQNHEIDGYAGGPRGSTITRNVFRNNGRAGVRFTSFGSADPARGCATTSVTQYCFTGNGHRVAAADPAAILYASGASVATCTFTEITFAPFLRRRPTTA
jgi:hypothetical protein